VQPPRRIVGRIDRNGRSTSKKVEMLIRALLCAACALAVTAATAHAAFPGQNGKIVFTSYDDVQGDIYTMSPSGRHVVNLTLGWPSDDGFARWSPDGRMLAFDSNRAGPANPTGDYEIFVMNADGSGVRQVTYNTLDDGDAAWSPDGGRLVFHRWFGDHDSDLITVKLNGTGERNVTSSPGVMDRQGAWSPDGREIAFSHGGDEISRPDIYTIHPDGSQLRQLTSTPADEEFPDWSPDAKKLAYHSDLAMLGEQWDVYVMRRDGSGQTRLTTAEGAHAGWSPDGRKIVFGSNRLGQSEIFTMRADGSRERQRTDLPLTAEGLADWQPLPEGRRGEEDDD
jgi:TolB protein